MAEEKGLLKLAKVNQREETYSKPVSKYSYRTVEAKRKVHDLELHNTTTGEPVFTVTPGYGRGEYHLDWHPYMKAMHPDLERSFEHGSRHHNAHRRMKTSSGKDYIASHGESLYRDASEAGFKDSLRVKTEKTHRQEPGSDYVETTTHNHFHDPETGEHIATERHNQYGDRRKITYNKEYISKHGIDPQVATNMKAPDGYRFAKALVGEKGKEYNAVGVKSYGDSNAGTSHYTLATGKTPEQASAAHEDHIRKTYGGKPEFKLTRHSPTSFMASHKTYEGEYADKIFHNSHADEHNLLHHRNTVPSSQYQGVKLDHKF